MPDPVASGLRPIERVVVRLHEQGARAPEIASRVGKKPGTVDRILQMVALKAGVAPGEPRHDPLRPVERVVVRLRERGESYGEIGNRLARSGRQVQMIERLAIFKLGQ